MSDAANNALLFEEEIDRRVLDAFIAVLNDRRLELETEHFIRSLVQHPIMREYISREVVYQTENALKRYVQAQYPPGKERDYRGASLKEPFYKW